jgi:magnesium chelatase subunit D
LLRLAEAMGRVSRTKRIDRAMVRDAAYTLGLIAQDGVGDSDDQAGDWQDPQGPEQPTIEAPAGDSIREPRIVTPVIDGEPQVIPNVRPSGPGDVVATPQDELEAMPVPLAPERSERETKRGPYGMLRLPWHQTRSAASGRGTVVGTRRAESLADLAIVETLVAAAPFQTRRRQALRRRSTGMILRKPDLRSYRRVPAAGDLLVLVLDYTSVSGHHWLKTLAPFLADAYSLRAELCVVKVGAASASHWLRADRVMARSVLVPSVAAALDDSAGKATPLADGLSLAFRTIRQTLGHGRATTRRATLIVITDGRGNVPLDASREGRWTARVGRQGVDDAKRVARELRELPHVRRVLIDPGPTYLRDLPLGLAAALSAEIVPVERGDG